jgi:hypothetical protein
MSTDTVSVVVATGDDDNHSPTKGGLFGDDVDISIVDIPVSTLKTNLSRECEKFVAIVDGIKSDGGFKLLEVEVGFEISGEGGVSFIGTSKLGARASLKMKFSKVKS